MSLLSVSALAQTIPGPADVQRIKPLEQPAITSRPSAAPLIPEIQPGVSIPESVDQVSIQIDRVKIEGATAFTQEQLADIYTPHLGKEVTLDTLWVMAGQLTERYRNAGYFLSRAYVPAQEIDDGTIILNVVEGYVGRVELENTSEKAGVINTAIEQLTSHKPLSTETLEAFVLRLNDLPGVEFRAFIEPLPEGETGAVKLVLRPVAQESTLSISADNFGSRFLGPYRTTMTYQENIMPLQQTTFSAFTSLPTDELRYGAVRHHIPIHPDWSVELFGSYVNSHPGSSLESSNIDSSSLELGVGLNWQPIRQRQENLSVSFNLGGRNTNGDILDNNPLTRDRIRAASLLVNYDTNDTWDGYNYLSASLNQGLSVFGASDKGDLNLSRAQAEPDFTSLQASYTRLQSIGKEWLVVGQVSGQVASVPLFSAEEFGYGGQGLGRAYDPSEITGDHGVAGSVEVRYQALSVWPELSTVPYVFYDVGRVWNEDTGSQPESAASAGFGVRVSHESGVSGNLGLAWPLTKAIATPIWGGRNDPRLLLQVGVVF